MDDLATYRVYYEDPNADPNDPLFEEFMAVDEKDAMRQASKIGGYEWTHAEFWEE